MNEHGKLLGVDQFAEFSAAVVRGLPRDINPDVAQSWIEDQKALAKILAECLQPPSRRQQANYVALPDGNGGRKKVSFRSSLYRDDPKRKGCYRCENNLHDPSDHEPQPTR